MRDGSGSLRDRLAKSEGIVRLIGVYDALSAIVADRAEVAGRRFDGLWSSSLIDSIVHGVPDMEILDLSSRADTAKSIRQVTRMPLLFDGNSGGRPEQLYYSIRQLENAGVSGIVVEDKVGTKYNSLTSAGADQALATVGEFCSKLTIAKAAQQTASFMIFARIESLIAGRGLQEALDRAHQYVGAGADGVMIHSRSRQPDEILDFCRRFRSADPSTPLMVVPTTYNAVTETELVDAGVSMVVYANQLARASYPALVRAADDLLRNERAVELDQYTSPAQVLLELIGGPPCLQGN